MNRIEFVHGFLRKTLAGHIKNITVKTRDFACPLKIRRKIKLT